MLTRLPVSFARQDAGSLQINRTVEGNPLSVGRRRYAEGLGTHANSDIHYQMPRGAREFSFSIGVDDEVAGKSPGVIFSVLGDGKELWGSPVIYGYERNQTTYTVDVRDVKTLQLRVHGSNGLDHADWINPIIAMGETGESAGGRGD